jgi:RNA polymerase sigma factor (sigma-70 family)
LEEIRVLIARATAAQAAHAEKSRAFGEIVRRFQDLAFACAFSVLGDFHLAEDAAQEAFLAAWRNLDQLRTPEAFPGWLKRVVLTQCNRLTRGKQVETVALDALDGLAVLPAAGSDPCAAYEDKERSGRVLAAIQSLPEHERIATALFYIGDYSQHEIAAFLEVPVTTIKKRLFSARHRLRERTMDMVRETLYERRPSRNPQFAETVALFTAALDSFVAKVKQDRYVIAAILYGSLSHDTVWRKSDIDIILIGREEKPAKSFALVENGVNIHATLYPRSKFKQALERSLHGSFWHSAFALSTLLFTTDDAIRAYYDDVRRVGSHDRRMRLMETGAMALHFLAKAEKWLLTRGDVSYSFLYVMYALQHLATIEVLLHGALTTREVVPDAATLNPALFDPLYTDFIQQPKDTAAIQRALDLINAYLDEHVDVLFGPILNYLRQEGSIRTTTEVNAYFAKQAQTETLSFAYEWLADKGIIQKVPSPIRLHPKSRVVLDEAAYYYDGLDGPAGPAGLEGAEGADRLDELDDEEEAEAGVRYAELARMEAVRR